MKYTITGADSTTGKDCRMVVEADSEIEAIAAAKKHGIFVSQINGALPSMYTSVAPQENAHAQDISPVARHKFDPTTRLSATLFNLALIDFVGAAYAGYVVGQREQTAGLIVFAYGFLGGLFLLAISKVLEYLCDSAHQLQRIAEHLESKKL